jgi:hypothetical protein
MDPDEGNTPCTSNSTSTTTTCSRQSRMWKEKRDLGLEGGEAPMDMDTKDEAENSSSSNAPGRDMCCSSI